MGYKIPNSIKEINEEIQELKVKMENITSERDSLLKSEPILLHEKLCRHNHTDACGWLYGNDNNLKDWEHEPRKKYLQQAEQLQKIFTCDFICYKSVYEIIEEVLEIIK